MNNRQVRVRVKSASRPRSSWEGVLVGLLGGVLGILFSCCLGVAVLSLLDTDPETTPVTSPPMEYDIETIVEEHYINRLFDEGVAGSQMPEFLASGRVDVRPGGLIDFDVQLSLGPLRPLLRGTVTLQVTADGELAVKLSELEAGRLSLAPLVPDRLLASVNEEINHLLVDRTKTMGVRLLALTSDETTLHLYLISDR